MPGYGMHASSRDSYGIIHFCPHPALLLSNVAGAGFLQSVGTECIFLGLLTDRGQQPGILFRLVCGTTCPGCFPWQLFLLLSTWRLPEISGASSCSQPGTLEFGCRFVCQSGIPHALYQRSVKAYGCYGMPHEWQDVAFSSFHSGHDFF